MKNFIAVLSAILAVTATIDAHKICEVKRIYIPASQNEQGHWRSGYWTNIKVCILEEEKMNKQGPHASNT